MMTRSFKWTSDFKEETKLFKFLWLERGISWKCHMWTKQRRSKKRKKKHSWPERKKEREKRKKWIMYCLGFFVKKKKIKKALVVVYCQIFQKNYSCKMILRLVEQQMFIFLNWLWTIVTKLPCFTKMLNKSCVYFYSLRLICGIFSTTTQPGIC